MSRIIETMSEILDQPIPFDEAYLIERLVQGMGEQSPPVELAALVAARTGLERHHARALCAACNRDPDQIVGRLRVWTYDEDEEAEEDGLEVQDALCGAYMRTKAGTLLPCERLWNHDGPHQLSSGIEWDEEDAETFDSGGPR